MKFEDVSYEKREGIAILTLDEPEKLNALSVGIRQGLLQALDEVERDDDVAVAIITGAGRAFCAGADITGLKMDDLKSARLFGAEIMGLFHKIEKISKPVIAAVNGLALGGGVEIAISCDMIVASEQAQFGLPEPRLGLVPGFGLLRLPQLVGRAKAKEIAMTTDNISAEEAHRIGMVNKVVPDERLMEEAVALAKKIQRQAPLAIQFTKSCINRQLGGEEFAYASDAGLHLLASEDVKEGTDAFLARRKPVFKGK